MANVNLDLSGFLFEANGHQHEIKTGHLITTHLENGSVLWDWQVALKLKKSDGIPSNKSTSLCYPDGSTFVETRVIDRSSENGLSVFTLVPFIKET